MASGSDLVADADRATASGDLARAQALLAEAAELDPGDIAPIIKLAGLQRATGKPKVALATIHRALALAPLDFTALLMRASLLDRLESPEAPEAWSHALAQRPEGDLPAQLAQVVAHGEARVKSWLDTREERMIEAMGDVEGRADEDQRRRFQRFRANVLRRTAHYHSEPTHFRYPGLPEVEFYPRRLFPWLSKLESATGPIAAELEALLAAERRELEPYVQYAEHLPLDQWRALNRNLDWSALHLFRNGKRVEANARHCPDTLGVLAECDQPQIAGASPNSMFSLLAPGTAIPPHVGVNNARLVCHLPLIVPDGCWFRVGSETRHWKRGEAFVFDDTIEHEAMNPTDELRIILIFDVWHPMIPEIEREAIAALIASEGGAPAEGL